MASPWLDPSRNVYREDFCSVFRMPPHPSTRLLSQCSKRVPLKTASLRYAVCGCCLCMKNANGCQWLEKTKIGTHRWSSGVSRFCFHSSTVPYQSPVYRAADAEQTKSCIAPEKEKESMEWRNRNPLQRAPQPRLDLANLAVTTGYHSLS